MRKTAFTLTVQKAAAILFGLVSVAALVSSIMPTSHPLAPRSIFRRAQVAYELQDYEKAERLWRQDLEEVQRSSADINCDIEYWCTESWLGALLMERGRFAESERLLKHALETSKNIHNPRYDEVANSMYRLANLYSLQGRNAEAALLRREADRLTTEKWAIRHKLLMLGSVNRFV